MFAENSLPGMIVSSVFGYLAVAWVCDLVMGLIRQAGQVD